MFKKVLAAVLVVGVSLAFTQVQNVKPLRAPAKAAVAAPVQAKKAEAKVDVKVVKIVPETTTVFNCDSIKLIKFDTVKAVTTSKDTAFTLTKTETAHTFGFDTLKAKTAKVKK
jgi:hypothetical protein